MEQKTVLITGASRGIGKALAQKFLNEGYAVIGTSTKGIISLKHQHFTMLKLDLTSTTSITQCLQEFLRLHKKIDILVNNAGVLLSYYEPSLDIDLLRRTMEVNLFGTITLTERLLDYMVDGGKIINISSSAGSISETTQTGYPSYNISKAALNMYTRTLAIRTRNKGIIVASIHPGWVETDMGGKGAPLKPEVAVHDVYLKIVTLKETGQFWYKKDKYPW